MQLSAASQSQACHNRPVCHASARYHVPYIPSLCRVPCAIHAISLPCAMCHVPCAMYAMFLTRVVLLDRVANCCKRQLLPTLRTSGRLSHLSWRSSAVGTLCPKQSCLWRRLPPGWQSHQGMSPPCQHSPPHARDPWDHRLGLFRSGHLHEQLKVKVTPCKCGLD